MGENNVIVITRDNFLHVLQLSDVQQNFKDRSEIDQLYKVLLDFLMAEKALKDIPEDQIHFREIALRIPGTPIHIRLSGVLRERLEDFIALYLILTGLAEGNWVKITASVIIGLIGKVASLKKDLGERCIIDSLGEIKQRTDREICINLFGRECRYPTANCQFMKQDEPVCQFEPNALRITLEALEKRQILKKENNVEPFIWGIVF